MLEIGGVDSYTNAISDTYQDNFGEGIYTGKGIYDLKIFSKVMNGKIPENAVLSHDLLEGSILRCGLSSDIILLDGYPSSFGAFIKRQERWIRGDWQIIPWLKEKYLNRLSKFKIVDNLRRSLISIFSFLNFILLFFAKMILNIKIYPFIAFTIIGLTISSIIDVINYIVFRKENIKVQKKFTKRIDGLLASVYRGIIEIGVLPYKAWSNLKAIIKTIYRMTVTKEHLLEWTTAEEAEKNNKNDLISVYKKMVTNVVFGTLGFVISIINLCATTSEEYKTFYLYTLILTFIWILAPFFMWHISKPIKEQKAKEKLNKEELEYIKNIAKKTWTYFSDLMNKENNYIPPDNFQESRREKVVHRTSSTNIGLGFMTIVCAYDMGFITLEKTVSMLENSLETVMKLDKWNGHLYNWYDTKNLKPLIPRYISTVDSGNFIRIYVHFKRVFN